MATKRRSFWQKSAEHLLRWQKLRPFGIGLSDYRAYLTTPKTGAYPVTLFGHPLQVSSTISYLHSLEELFVDEVYRFDSDNPRPYILDCGANWGLSILYFKRLYPQARIVAFEPDEQIFRLLQHNVQACGFSDVTIRREAIWTANTTLDFTSDFSLGGRIIGGDEAKSKKHHSLIPAIDLRPLLLEQDIDFLKMDIEGAEYEVIRHCAQSLHRVKRLFIEYHSRPGEPQMLAELLALVKSAGFEVYLKEAAINKKHPFTTERLPYIYDMQLNIFCYRPA